MSDFYTNDKKISFHLPEKQNVNAFLNILNSEETKLKILHYNIILSFFAILDHNDFQNL
jgi:hypothetical protein